MRAVHVGVGHDDDAAVAQLAEIEAVADAAAQRLDQVLQLLVLPQLVGRGAGDVQDLAAQRQHRLGLAVARLLGRAAGGIALDQEDLGLRGVLPRAVGQLAGQPQPPRGGLARGVLALAPAEPLLGPLDDEGQQVVGRASGRRPASGRTGRAARSPPGALASRLVSFSLVWPWNCGSRRNTRQLGRDRPSRSSAVTCAAPRLPRCSPQARRPFTSAARNPASCVPPWVVGMVLQ